MHPYLPMVDQPNILKCSLYQVFFWTHKICYMLFWVLLILHGPNFWCWFVGPAVLLLLEAFSETTIVKALRFGKTYVKEVNLLPSGVSIISCFWFNQRQMNCNCTWTNWFMMYGFWLTPKTKEINLLGEWQHNYITCTAHQLVMTLFILQSPPSFIMKTCR